MQYITVQILHPTSFTLNPSPETSQPRGNELPPPCQVIWTQQGRSAPGVEPSVLDPEASTGGGGVGGAGAAGGGGQGGGGGRAEAGPETVPVHGQPAIGNPQPQSLYPTTSSPNPKHQTPNPQPSLSVSTICWITRECLLRCCHFVSLILSPSPASSAFIWNASEIILMTGCSGALPHTPPIDVCR